MFSPMETQELKPGMRVGRDVLQGGALLVQAGALLSDPVITVLRRRGVEEVVVELGNETRSIEADDLARREEERSGRTTRVHVELGVRATEKLNNVMQRIKAQFRGYDEDVVMQPLLLAAHRFWRMRIADEFKRDDLRRTR